MPHLRHVVPLRSLSDQIQLAQELLLHTMYARPQEEVMSLAWLVSIAVKVQEVVCGSDHQPRSGSRSLRSCSPSAVVELDEMARRALPGAKGEYRSVEGEVLDS